MKAPAGAGSAAQRQVRGDADVGEVDRGERGAQRLVGDVDDRGGLEAGADALVAALDLERAGDDAAGAADAVPLRGERGVVPVARGGGEVDEVDRAVLAGEAGEPDLLHGEGQHRREPGDEAVEERVEHGAGGAAARAGRGVAVERVLADVEVEGREVDGGELEEGLEDPLEVVGGVALQHLLVELGQPVQHPALELGHLRRLDALGLVEAVEGAEQEAQGVAQPAVAVGGALQDLRADARGRRYSRTARPRAAGCRRRTGGSRPRARWCCRATSTSSCRSRRA